MSAHTKSKRMRRSAPRSAPSSGELCDLRSYGRQLIDEDDIQAVVDVLGSDLLTTGPTVATFEMAFSKAIGSADVVVVSSGTAGLHLAALSSGIGPGDVCIVPSMTFVATANAARYVGAEVVFADVDADTGLMRPEDFHDALQRAKRRPVRAVFPVHFAGQTVDLSAIVRIAQEGGIAVIEDACHALGTMTARPDGVMRTVGGYGHSGMSVFSMHPVKTVAMGEGGAVATDDPGLARRLRLLRNHGITREPAEFAIVDEAFDRTGGPNPWYNALVELGYNYRASDIHCALGLSQLRKLERFVDKRRQLRSRYREALAPLAPLVRPVPEVPYCRAAWHLMVVLIDFAGLAIDRAEFMRALAGRNIGTQVHYLPVHRHPYYRSRYGEMVLPGAERFYDRCISLPLHAGMTESDVDHVVSAVADILGLEAEL